MHIEYAADAILRMEAAQYTEQQQVQTYVTEKELLTLAASLGGVTSEIASSVREIAHAFKKTNRKVTDKQRFALSAALLEKHGTARAVFAAAYSVSIDEFMANAGQ